jgi:Transglycosylase SLT domain
MSTVTKEAIIAAIYGQESSSGTADTSKENYAGAIGPMQVIRPTFDSLKNKGIIPANYDFNNPEHTKDAGEKLVGFLFDKYGGDHKKVAAAYYAGEKAIRKDGTIANFRDLKNNNAPTTHQYVADIERRLSGESTVLPAAAAAPMGRSDVLASWDAGFGPRAPKPEKAITDGSVAPIQPAPPLAPGAPVAVGLMAEEAALRAVEQKAQDTPFIEMSQNAFMSTLGGAALRNRVMRETLAAFPPDPKYMLDPKELAGHTADEQDYLREAASQGQLEQIKHDIGRKRDEMATVNIKGTGMGIAASILSGLPEGYLSGMGAARGLSIMRAGSIQLAKQGRTGAALLSSVAENVGVNTAMVAAQDSFDPYVGATDYAFGVGFGLIGVGLTAPHVFGKSTTADIHATAEALKEQSAGRTAQLREEAVSRLGPDATPEALQGEVRRLEANAIRQETSAATSAIPEQRRLLPEDDGLRVDVEPAQADQPLSNVRDGMPRSSNPLWDDPMYLASRIERATTDPKWDAGVRKVLEGSDIGARQAMEMPAGVHVVGSAQKIVSIQPAVKAVQELAAKYLPDQAIIIGSGATNKAANAEIISMGRAHVIGLTDNPVNPSGVMRSGMHELGHAVFHANAKYIPSELLNKIKSNHGEFLSMLKAGDKDAGTRRLSITNEDAMTLEGGGKLAPNEYNANFDEYMAEQFVKHIETKIAKGEGGFSKQLVDRVVAAVRAVMDFFMDAKARGYLKPDEGADEFFERVLAGTLKQTKKMESEFLAEDLILPSSFDRSADLVNDPTAVKHGLSLMPVDTPQQKAEAAAVTALYKKADELAPKVDEKRLSKLMDTALFQGAQGTANVMLRSANPVVRMVAAELLESASGAAGRRSSASIAKYMNEQAYLGNTLNEFQGHYKAYRNANGESVVGDFFDGKMWEQFNRLVAEEIEGRANGARAVESPPTVRAAADGLEAAYERMRVAQVDTKTIGWAALPGTSKGYMPHKMSPEKVRNMTTAQAEALQGALRDQFIQIDGFDITFAENLSRKYIDRVQRRALGGFDAPVGVHQVGAADIVEDALQAMGLTQPEVVAMMGKYMKGAAGHTKKRLKLDLGAEHPMPDGTSFKLMDLFETDQFKLLRSQANRVSGETALARHGVMGKSGLKLLRRAMEFGGDGEKATAKEFEAFDQIAAEFMGDSFGTQSKLVDRAMQVNSLARLGGMGFTQFAESINGIFHVGAAKTLSSISSMGRLRSEIKALARGEKVDNPIIGSLEQYGGAEFGTQSYKTVFPFDNGSLQYQTYGQDTINAADRLLRGGTFVQGKLSGWRAIHSAQQRGMAEQIVRKAAEYIKGGKNDVALRDMGISDELMAKLRADIDNIATWEGSSLRDFDISKATDTQAAAEFTQAIHRGVSQIIQGTFIGEQGAWAHSGMMRLMTQFRTFSLTSVEKQWARQVGNVGTVKTLLMMLGAMSLAAPIYMARTYLASIGRPDQDAYLEKQLTVAQIARASLNYIAMSGLAGDFLDATTAVTGIGKVTGGRSGVGSEFVGNVVAPAAGLVDDVWRAVQNTKEGTDPHDLLKTLPFNRHPLLIPAINALGD